MIAQASVIKIGPHHSMRVRPDASAPHHGSERGDQCRRQVCECSTISQACELPAGGRQSRCVVPLPHRV